jgi:hypothetical protein
MANLTQFLTSFSPDLRSGSSPGRRLLALVLCSMLILASISPGVALAGEADSEGEGTSPQVELPELPDFDPGGEETDLEEVPATGGGEEEGAVEIEPEVDTAAPPPEEVTSAAAEAPVEAPSPRRSRRRNPRPRHPNQSPYSRPHRSLRARNRSRISRSSRRSRKPPTVTRHPHPRARLPKPRRRVNQPSRKAHRRRSLSPRRRPTRAASLARIPTWCGLATAYRILPKPCCRWAPTTRQSRMR